MSRWCCTLLSIAVATAMASGCAQPGGIPRDTISHHPSTEVSQQAVAAVPRNRSSGPSSTDSPIVQTSHTDSAETIHHTRMTPNTVVEAEPSQSEPPALPAAVEAPELELAELRLVRGVAPDEDTTAAAPGSELPTGGRSKLTLSYLSRLATENHPILRRDQARIASAAGQALQAGLYPNPVFDTNNPQIFAGPLGTAFNVGFQQEIVVKGKLRLDRAAALRAQQQAELAYILDRYTLLAEVRNQFYQTLAAQFRVDVLTQLLSITEASMKTGEERVKATIADRQELLLLEIDYNRVKAGLENAIKILEGERKQLAAIVGYPGLVDARVIGSLTADPPQFNEEAMEQFLTSENALVQIAKLEVDRNKILLKRAEVEPYPNVTIGPAYQYGLNKTQEQYWVTVVFPIPVSNRNQGNISSARADIRDAVETISTVQLDLLRRMADALSTHRGALEQADKYKTRIIPEARETLRLAKSAYDAGVLEFSVYLQAQRTLMEATQDYVNILEKVWTSASDLSGLMQMDEFP